MEARHSPSSDVIQVPCQQSMAGLLLTGSKASVPALTKGSVP
jgi:hypothetical protein